MEVTINGNGATIQREETAPAFRIVHLSFGGHLTLKGVSISSGDVGASFGGGIRNGSMLTLSSSIISGNTFMILFLPIHRRRKRKKLGL